MTGLNLKARWGGALGDTLSGRLAVGIIEQGDGWQTLDLKGLGEFGPGVDADNGALSKQGIRGSLLWEPSDEVDVLLVFDYAEDNSESLAFEHAGNLLVDGGGFCSLQQSVCGMKQNVHHSPRYMNLLTVLRPTQRLKFIRTRAPTLARQVRILPWGTT